jgi:hypothetical protein
MHPEIHANMLAALPIDLHASRPIGLTLRKGWKATAVQRHYLDILSELARDS